MFPAVDDPVLARPPLDGACPEEPVVSETGLEFVVEAENEALGRFVDELERMDSQRVAQDRPVADWVDDWKSLLRARVAFHERLDSDLDAPLPAVPSVDGYSIAVRMSEIGGVNCEPAPWILDDFDMSGVRTTRRGELNLPRKRSEDDQLVAAARANLDADGGRRPRQHPSRPLG